jgi:hypothetical protein
VGVGVLTTGGVVVVVGVSVFVELLAVGGSVVFVVLMTVVELFKVDGSVAVEFGNGGGLATIVAT